MITARLRVGVCERRRSKEMVSLPGAQCHKRDIGKLSGESSFDISDQK